MDLLDDISWDSEKNAPLVDGFGRHITYIRLSVTDRCDFRCSYCMSENMTFLPKKQILSLEELYPEIERLTAAFVNRQYAGKKPPGERPNQDWAAVSSWRRIRGRMWLLGLLNRIQ